MFKTDLGLISNFINKSNFVYKPLLIYYFVWFPSSNYCSTTLLGCFKYSIHLEISKWSRKKIRTGETTGGGGKIRWLDFRPISILLVFKPFPIYNIFRTPQYLGCFKMSNRLGIWTHDLVIHQLHPHQPLRKTRFVSEFPRKFETSRPASSRFPVLHFSRGVF